MLKKAMNSQGMIVVGNKDDKYKFPPGFAYRIEGLTYTVKERVTQESGSEMRRVEVSDGHTEIMAVSSIEKDLKEIGCKVIAQGQLPLPVVSKKETKKEEKVKKSKVRKTKKE